MTSTQTSKELIEQLETLPYINNNQEESKNLIQLLKLALLKDKSDYNELAQNMDEGIAQCKLICNSDGTPYDYRFLSVNKAFENQSGIPINNSIGRTILEIFPDIEKTWIKFYGDVALTQQPNSTTQYNHNTKKHYTTSAYSSTIGEFIMIIKDITETVELATTKLDAVKRQEQNLAVLDNMNDGYAHCEIICDHEGKPIDYRILTVNNAYEIQTGIKAKDIVGKTFLEIFPDIEKFWIETYGKVALSRKSNSFLQFNHNTGRQYQTNAISTRKGEFTLFFRDVTDIETKRTELEKAYLKVEENDKLKSAFLSNMSHEIRTPMNAILGFSSLLEDDAVSKKDKKICLKHIKSSGNRLLILISDIVDISKIDAKQQKLVFKKIDLNLLFDELYKRYSILNTNIELSIKVNKEREGTFIISTDETRLNQILSNLIDNAIKYTPKGEVEFGYSLKNNKLEFYVKDSGIGIQKENQKIIFERFTQVNNPSYNVASGTGLGISIAKGLVELFKGKIWLTSELKKGSVFYFNIPINP